MCELLALVGPRPFAVLDVLPPARAVERWGIAGMGWGIAWIDATSGELCHYKRETALRDDGRAPAVLDGATTTAVLVHLRRPSLLSTISLADTQPFVASHPPFAFAHNGDFRRHLAYRDQYAARGVLYGRADTEVGFHHLVALRGTTGPADALSRLQAEMEGPNNYLYLGGDGMMLAYAAGQPTPESNPMYQFRLSERSGVVTGLYSSDRAVFSLALPGAVYERDLPAGQAVALTPPVPATA